jgi:hypothetical protein
MIHTAFWLTGMVTWFLLALATAMFFVTNLHDRSVVRRARNGRRYRR